MYTLLAICLYLPLINHSYGESFEEPKNVLEALQQNGGQFDYGFTITYVGEEPFEFEYYLFIGQHYWRPHKKKNNEREICLESVDSEQHLDFGGHKYELAFSYLSDHMVEHSNELNLTNHILLQMKGGSERIHEDYREHTREIIESIFDANHDSLLHLIAQDFYVNQIPAFYPSVAFQPQSFVDNEDTDGPNFVFIEQKPTDDGYERRIEVHSIIDDFTIIRNRTDQYRQYIPAFIDQIDSRLYLNAILPTRLGPGGYDEGVAAVIVIVADQGVIKYCITEEDGAHHDCLTDNLKQLQQCIRRDEL